MLLADSGDLPSYLLLFETTLTVWERDQLGFIDYSGLVALFPPHKIEITVFGKNT